VIGTVLDWIMILFAIGSGISKVMGIPAERQVTDKFGINYYYIIALGLFQLVSVPLIYFQHYFLGFILLGAPYLLFVYFGLKHKNHVLSVFSGVIVGITLSRWLLSI
jgi:hypothetical protein